MKVAQIRQAFLEYFQSNGHTIMPSASLIPKSDPSLLFINAGMVPFKTCFLGVDEPKASQLTSAQHCLRVGGKHNDLDNVGKTARHHTFFEMLGNFSFGAYDKATAIKFAWVFLTEVLKLPLNKLWVTVHHSDDKAKQIWIEDIGVPVDRVITCGDDDNFWSMGDTGPCGPCTEIFYDHGPEVAGGPPGSDDADGDRYVEIWNIVFMEFDRSKTGEMSPLPKPCVDTGMGLERIAAVLQGVHSNYDIDLFQTLINAYQKLANHKIDQTAAQVVADHMRSICWLIHDGVLPSNEGRGYVLRRIIRRALRFAYVDQMALPCLYKLVKVVVSLYQHNQAFVKDEQRMTKVLQSEEEAFTRTIEHGLKLFEKFTNDLAGDVISGDLAFKLYDTYGFPVDLVVDLAHEKQLTVDLKAFADCMQQQKDRSRQHQQFTSVASMDWLPDVETKFEGYLHMVCRGRLLCLYSEGHKKTALVAGEKAMLVFDCSPFYAESGGQVGDRGVISNADGRFIVHDTQKQGQCIIHQGVVDSGMISVDTIYQLEVDAQREKIKRNHSATHLLHDALIDVLGEHVAQKGSLVEADRLRFDFSHHAPLTPEQIEQIEQHVNHAIAQNHEVHTNEMSLDQAKSQGVKALFDEKYADEVRVLSMGKSRELCGGTHVQRTGDIGTFVLVEQTAVAQGIRRVEAVTADLATKAMQQYRSQLQSIAAIAQSPVDALTDKLVKMSSTIKSQQKVIDQLYIEHMRYLSQALLNGVENVGPYKVIMHVVDFDQAKLLRVLTQACLSTKQVDIVILWMPQGEKMMLSVGVISDKVKMISAVDAFKAMASVSGAKGGGKADFAQGSMSHNQSEFSSIREKCRQNVWTLLQA